MSALASLPTWRRILIRMTARSKLRIADPVRPIHAPPRRVRTIAFRRRILSPDVVDAVHGEEAEDEVE